MSKGGEVAGEALVDVLRKHGVISENTGTSGGEKIIGGDSEVTDLSNLGTGGGKDPKPGLKALNLKGNKKVTESDWVKEFKDFHEAA